MDFSGSSASKESACNAGDPISIPVWGRSPREGMGCLLQYSWASLVSKMVKNLPAIQNTWVQSLDWEDPLEKGMATHSSILAWRILWTEEPGKLQSMGSQRLGHNWATKHSTAYSVYLTEDWIVLEKWWIRNAPCTWEGCWTHTYMCTHTLMHIHTTTCRSLTT